MTHPKFLRLYKNILQANGIIHLKTDSPDLYNFTKAVIDLYHLKITEDKDDLYKDNNISEALKIKTHYENLDIAQSNKVHYLAFELNADLPKEKDEQLKALFREQALTEDDDYYFNNDGLVVFTKEYLLERGYCCGNGCVNCPYDYKMVPNQSERCCWRKERKKTMVHRL